MKHSEIKQLLKSQFEIALDKASNSPYEVLYLDTDTRWDEFKLEVEEIILSKNIESYELLNLDNFDCEIIANTPILVFLEDHNDNIVAQDSGSYLLFEYENHLYLIGGMNLILGIRFKLA